MTPPTPPRALREPGRRAWRAARSQAGVDAAARELVEAYAFAVDRAHHLRQAWREAGSPATSTGAHGGAVVAHPLLAAIERAEEHARRLAHELGLTPQGRRRIAPARRGRPPGRDPLEALGAPPLRVVE